MGSGEEVTELALTTPTVVQCVHIHYRRAKQFPVWVITLVGWAAGDCLLQPWCVGTKASRFHLHLQCHVEWQQTVVSRLCPTV